MGWCGVWGEKLLGIIFGCVYAMNNKVKAMGRINSFPLGVSLLLFVCGWFFLLCSVVLSVYLCYSFFHSAAAPRTRSIHDH